MQSWGSVYIRTGALSWSKSSFDFEHFTLFHAVSILNITLLSLRLLEGSTLNSRGFLKAIGDLAGIERQVLVIAAQLLEVGALTILSRSAK